MLQWSELRSQGKLFKKKEVKEIEFSLPSNPYFLGCFSIFLDGFWHSRKCKILVVKEQDTDACCPQSTNQRRLFF